MLYGFVLVSAIHQHESAIGIHVSTPSHPYRLSQSRQTEPPVSFGKFPLAVCVTYGDVYVSVLYVDSIHIH